MFDKIKSLIKNTHSNFFPFNFFLGIPYSDANTDPNLQNYAVTGENSNSSSSSSTTSSSMGIIVSSGSSGNGSNNAATTNCHCSLNAMVICSNCGAFTHEDCVQKQKLCVSCVIR